MNKRALGKYQAYPEYNNGEIGVVGYDIPFYHSPRALEAIDTDFNAVSRDTMNLLQEVRS